MNEKRLHDGVRASGAGAPASQDAACTAASVLGLISEGVLVFGPDARVRDVNAAAAALLGVPVAGLLGRALAELAWEPIREDGSAIAADLHPVAQALASGATIDGGVLGLRCAQGGRRWARVRAAPIEPGTGAGPGVVCCLSDVTDHREAALELQRRAAAFEAIAENSPDVIFRFDRELRHTYVNRAFESLTKVPRRALLGRTCRELALLPEYAVQALEDAVAHAFRTREERSVEIVLERPEGRRHLDARIVPEVGPAGEVVAALMISRDMSARQHASEALAASEARLARAQRIARLGCWELDLATRGLCVSDEVLRIFGREAGGTAFTYDAFMEAVHPDDRARIAREVDLAIEHRAPYRQAHRVVHSDGTVVFVHCEGEVTCDDEGRPVRVFGTVHDMTEHRRVADTLRRTQALLDALLENAPTPIVVIGADGRYEVANAAWQHVFARSDPTGLTAREIFPAPLARRLEEQNARVLRQGEPVVEELALPAAGGERWLHIVKFPVRVGEGETAVGAVVVDVTARREAERALRLQDEQLRLTSFAVEHAGDATFWIDSEGRVLYVNRSACEHLGYTAAELLRMRISDIDPLFPQEDWAGHFDELRRRGALSIETLHRSRSGRTYPVEITAKYIVFEGREYNCAFVRDVSERKHAEDALRESQSRLQRAQRVARIGDWMHDFRTGRIAWSDELYRLFEVDPCAGDPPSIETLMARVPEDGAVVEDRIRRALAGEAGEFEVRIQLPSGRVAYFHETIWPERDQTGEIVQLYGTVQDVTERRCAEEERAHLLAREQQARSEAERANRAKDVFLATLSHELRTPLTTVLAWAQMLRRGSVDASRLPYAAQRIERAVLAQKQLIEDLLDVSRIILGKLELAFHRVDPAAIVAAAVDTVRPTAEEKAIRLEVSLGAAGAVVSADAVRLQQVVWNLLANAVKFTAPGGLVSLSLERLAPSGPWPAGGIRVRVSDNGRGISPDFQPHVFTRFSQADSSTTRQHGGLGLGLAIARQLVELHGGRIRVESPGLGLGAVFTVELPAAEAVAEAAAPAPPKVDACAAGGRPLGGVRVLLVEDEPSEREAFSEVLKALGAVVTPVASVREGLEALAVAAPDVVVSDLSMPVEDGFEFIRRLRSAGPDGVSALPSLALTAFAGADASERALASGFDGFLSKPVSAEALVEGIAAARAARTASHERQPAP